MLVNKDHAGILLSSLCLIHCLAGPIIIALGLTSVSMSFLSNEKFHLALVLPIVLVAAWSLPRGFKLHQTYFPIVVALIGIVFLISGLIFEEMESVLTVTASLLLIFAHFSNQKLLKKKVA